MARSARGALWIAGGDVALWIAGGDVALWIAGGDVLSAALDARVARREGRGAGDVHVKGLVVSCSPR